MPMVGSTLATLIKSAIAGIDEGDRDHDAVWNAIGDAIVSFIASNAVVTVTSVAGVTPGIGVSGPGVGTVA